MKKLIKKALPVLFWIVIWQLVAIIIHNKILMAGPIETLQKLLELSGNESFWASIGSSLGHILLGFVIGTVLGIVFAFLAYKEELVRDFVRPIVGLLKTVPVASFVILLLIWLGSSNISIFISAMVVFPIIYVSTLEGFDATDYKLLEMAHTFRMPEGNVIRYIYLPQLIPFFKSSFKLAIGMAFKSGIAAEVIGQPLETIGNGLYNAKIYLETGELFAWTIAIVVISFICEKILLLLLHVVGGRKA